MPRFISNTSRINFKQRFCMDILAPTSQVGPFFRFKIDTTKVGVSNSNQFKLPLISGQSYDFIINWGDNQQDHITSWSQSETTHTFSTSGIKYCIILLFNTFGGWSFNNDGDRLKLVDIIKWGDLPFGQEAAIGAFYGCANLTTLTATDAPTFISNGTLESFFYGCTNFNSPINHWDVSNITSLRRMFRSATAFNQPIGSWDVGNVTNMNTMFEGATAFNQNIGSWDVSNVTNLFTFCNGATAFNNGGSDSIKNWNTSKVYWLWATFKDTSFNQPIGSWDVSRCYAMNSMFKNTPFNQDISGWDTSFCTTMAYMFGITPAFNQDISGWNVESVASFNDMLGQADVFKRNVGAWWMRGASNGFANMFFGSDMNLGGSPVNLVTNAQDFSSANWVKTNLTTTANTTTAPDGTTTADSLKPSVTDSADHSVYQSKTVVNGSEYTVRVALKASQLTWGELTCTGAITANVYVNLSTGAIESSVGSVSVTDIGSGWYVLEITGTASTTSLAMRIKAWNNASGTSFAGNASDAIFAWQASMFASAGKSLDNYSNFLKDSTGWTGSDDGAANRTGVTAASVAVGGSGYVVGDILTVVGGTLGIGSKSAEVKVATIDESGAVLTVTLHRCSGNYDTQPVNAASTTGGTGSDCTLTLTWGTKFAGLPSNKSFHAGTSKYSMKDRLAVNSRKKLGSSVGSGGKGWTITEGGAL